MVMDVGFVGIHNIYGNLYQLYSDQRIGEKERTYTPIYRSSIFGETEQLRIATVCHQMSQAN